MDEHDNGQTPEWRYDDFISLYLRHCGTTEVPREFHRWACLTLIAACVRDHIWIEKHAGAKLRPNVYTMLVGPSGLGKGQAIDTAARLVADKPALNIYYGRTSGQHMADFMGANDNRGTASKRRRDEPAPLVPQALLESQSKVFLITEELSLCIGSGSMADDFVKYMTGLYVGSPVPMRDGTRTHGETVLYSPCLSWLAGTTREWLLKSVTPDAIEGGFFARTFLIEEAYDFTKVIVTPEYPSDLAAIRDELRERLDWLLAVEHARVRVSAKAREVESQWYRSERAEPPREDSLLAVWKRRHDLMLKLATLCALSDWTARLRWWLDSGGTVASECPLPVVESHHMLEAQRLLRQAHATLPELMRVASVTPATRCEDFVMRHLKRDRAVAHSDLLRRASARGYAAKDVAVAVQSLLQQETVASEQRRKGRHTRTATWYKWVGRKYHRPLRSVPDAEDADETDVESSTATMEPSPE